MEKLFNSDFKNLEVTANGDMVESGILSISSNDNGIVKYVQEAHCGGQLVSRRLSNGKMDVRICYPREFLRSCADSPYAILPPSNIVQMVFEMSEILAKFPRRYHAPTSIFDVRSKP